MPATRRKAPAATAATSQSSQQSTLSFNNRSSRVTKANVNTAEQVKKSKLSQHSVEEAVTAISTPEPEATIETSPETANVIVLDSPTSTKSTARKRKTKRKSDDGLEDVRAKAAKISDSQIRKYWKAEEDSRLAPRIHQTLVPLPEKILRHFDLSSQYGPCIGIPRLQRWTRASRLDLDPPIEVLAVLLKEEAKSERGQEMDAGRIAYIDELGGGGKGSRSD